MKNQPYKRKKMRPVMNGLMSRTLDEEFVDAVALPWLDPAPMFGMVIEDTERGDVMKTPKVVVLVDRECYMCGKQVTEDDYCHGCKMHICSACDAPLDERPWGEVHLPEMHTQAS